jgi:hypothetical protein
VDQVLLAVAVVALLVGIPGGVFLLGRRARRRGIRASLFAPLEELYDPVVHRTTIEVQVLAERESPAPSPDDRP